MQSITAKPVTRCLYPTRRYSLGSDDETAGMPLSQYVVDQSAVLLASLLLLAAVALAFP
jgi:hypothetical protein